MNLLLAAGLLVGETTMAQTTNTPPIPKTYRPSNHKMYHKGWIDFNKNGTKDTYEDPSAPIEERVEDLLRQMTVEEKTCQMVTLYGYGRVLKDDLPNASWKTALWKDGIGAIDEHLNGFRQWGLPPSDNPYVWPASRHAWAINEVQRFFVEETRLGIPADMTNEGIRGVEAYKATNFPTQLGLGHTWDRDLVRRVGYITGREGKLLGYTNIYAPILDVGRDQRWGRYEEVYGEAPYLVAELGIAMTNGLQKDAGVAATGKHFIAYSNNKGAREGFSRCDPQMSPREVEMVHVYPWQRVIGETGLWGVMSSYNDYDGFPIQSSYYWLMQRLRGDFGFKGYIVSDSDAVEYLYAKHHTARDMVEAVLQSVRAGLNVRCTFRSTESYVLPLRELIKQGALSMQTIDDRVRDILRVKFAIGLFDQPYQTDLQAADREVNSNEHQAVALEAARKSLVLLKNEGGLLPLCRDSIRRIAVCGPNAAATTHVLTHYGPLAVDVTTILDGLKAKAAPGTIIDYTKGCDLVDANWPESELVREPLTAAEQAEIDKAVEMARKSDVAVVVLGGNTRTCGENKSRSSLELPGRQNDLLQAVVATGKPVVLVLINGRPLTINWADRHVPAILEAWYPGSQGGTAVAEALFGDINPGGKLTVTFPKTVGQIPFNFPAKPASQVNGGSGTGMGGNMSRAAGALYPFGYGLSYTTFKYSNLAVSPTVVSDCQEVCVECDLTNTGDTEGDEVVQLYIRDLQSSVTTYEKNLVGFERVHLKPGESRHVSFTINPRDLRLLNADGHWVVEPGDFKVMVAASSVDTRLEGTFTVAPYGEQTTLQSKPEAIVLAGGKGTAAALTDNNPATGWQAAAGQYATFTLKDNAEPKQMRIRWGDHSTDAEFEIQLSSG
ncbi:MAG: glycoside hydrolase family 3 C-terminal domain-containing protein, partial [Alloprevotella sp.]